MVTLCLAVPCSEHIRDGAIATVPTLFYKKLGVGMGMPLLWQRRQAIVLASQLPDNLDDALMVLQALNELVEDYLVANKTAQDGLGTNILPFKG